ncbi:hypothetical protein AcW1_003501 [Taiwanofungus camphoratus]|nr:hypothetical protein AcV5_002036 [Antrodia cinnamomea]KAI0941679.1 hypothetical protein AcW1_003501 [Antrodia cinnamomea]
MNCVPLQLRFLSVPVVPRALVANVPRANATAKTVQTRPTPASANAGGAARTAPAPSNRKYATAEGEVCKICHAAQDQLALRS